MLAAGGVTAGGTLILNAHYGRSWGDNLLKNVAVASGAAFVTTGVGMAVTGGIASGAVQQVIYRGGNAIVGYCASHPVACTRAVVGVQLWDKLEDVGLQAKLALQTARGDPGAADTALELQLERLDNMPGNTTFREVLDEAVDLFRRKSDETVQIARVLARLGTDVEIGDDGMIRIGAGVTADAVEEAVEELRLIPDRKVWAFGNTIYINSPTVNAVEAVSKLRTAVNSGADAATKARLIEEVVNACTHGSGDRVVLGIWKEGGGYIGEAVEHGGIFFETSDEVWDMLVDSGMDPWLVNEQFLQKQLESGVESIEFVSGNILDILNTVPDTSFRVKEIKWMLEHADDYGYKLIGNSWIKK